MLEKIKKLIEESGPFDDSQDRVFIEIVWDGDLLNVEIGSPKEVLAEVNRLSELNTRSTA